MNTLIIKDIPLTQELSVDAARNIVGGKPLVIGVSPALVRLVAEAVLEPAVKITKDEITFLGQTVKI